MVTTGMAPGRSLPFPSVTAISTISMPRGPFFAAFTAFGRVVIFRSDRYVLEDRQIRECNPAGVADIADDAPGASGRHIAARTRIGLSDLAGGKQLLLLDHHDAATVAALLISPDARSNEAYGVHDVRRPVGADLALRTLRRVAANRQGRIDQEVEPIGALFDLRAALGP